MPCTDKYLRQIHLSACFILKSGIIIRPTFVCFWHHVFLLWENAAKLSERKWGAVRAEYCTHAQKHQMCFWFQKLFLFGTGPFLWKNINCKCITSQVFFLQRHKKTQAVRANTFTYFYYININTKRSRREVRHWEHPQNVPVCPTILLGLVVSEL